MESFATSAGNVHDQPPQDRGGGIAESLIPLFVGAFVVGLVIGRFSSR